MTRACLALLLVLAGSLPAQQAVRPTQLRVITINDFHGALTAWQDGTRGLRGGAPALAATIHAAERECVAPRCVSVLVDGGDMFQGTLLSNLSYGRTVLELYRTLGVAASAVGNHEFDWTIDTLRARMHDASFAMLGANVRYADGRDVEWIRDDTIVVRGALKIGIIGLSTVETPRVTMPSNVVSLRFVPLADVARERAAGLKAHGADVVLVVGHIGARCDSAGAAPMCSGEAIELARAVANSPIDVIVAGHSHTLVQTRVGDIPVVEAMSSGRAIAIVDIPIGANGAIRSGETATVRQIATDSIAPDPAVALWLAAKERELAPLINQRIGAIAGPAATVFRPDSGGGALVADAYRAAGHADVGVTNNGGVRRPMYAGPMTYGAAFDVLPFQNHLIRVAMPATAFRKYAEEFVRGRTPGVHVSGVRITYDADKPQGSRIVSVTRPDGTPIADADLLTVVINNFMEENGDGLKVPAESTARVDLGVDVDGFVAFVRAFGSAPIQMPLEKRFVRVTP